MIDTGTGTGAVQSTAANRFSLFAGGPLYRIALRLGVVNGESTLPRLGVAFALLTWTPLAVLVGLTAVSGFSPGRPAVPFLMSLGTHIRFLLAIPLFFTAEAWIGPRLGNFLGQIVESGLVLPEDAPLLDRAVGSATRLRDSAIAEVGLAVLAVFAVAGGVRVDLSGDASTWRSVGGVLTWAGRWYVAVGLPVFQFLWWRWCWRLVIWTRLLWRLSRLNLQLVPTHPDLSGGLGYLGVAHGHFGTLGLTASAVLSASFAEQILFGGQRLEQFVPLLGGIVALNLLAFVGPLLFFAPRLLEVKRRGLRQYGVVAATYTHLFDAKWVQGRGPTDQWLGSSDIQSLADLANSFAVVRNMRVTPFGPPLVLGLLASTIAPMAPLLLFQFSPGELLPHLLRFTRLLLG